MTTNTEALRLARGALKDCRTSGKLDNTEWERTTAAVAAIDVALAQQPQPSAEPVLDAAKFSPVTVLPDGSAFATASFPLPKDHWLYAPRGEWDNVRDEYAECPAPILNNSHAQAVRTAIKYAVRGATMCGQEMDFDPDAVVQNAIYALCGPANAAVLPVDSQPAPAPAAQPVAWAQLGMRNGHTYVRMHYEGHLYPPPPDVQRNLNLVPLYAAAHPAPAAQPLTEAQIADIVREASRSGAIRRDGSTSVRIARAIEAAHGIGATPAPTTEKEQ